ncbi:MAG: helix-turn-helix domain-containing protein [Oscillospiraceae bacterium]|jgi:transcriptional regulator with XRE-family HTH domain
MPTCGEKIKKARESLNLTQEQLGEKIGVTGVTIMRYEKGLRQPRIEQLCAIADALDIGIDYLLDTQKKSAPTLTKKDERDIARDLEKIMEQLDASGDLMFDGDPMSEEARESIKAAMKLGLEAAKLKNKARFTPKKYRGD